jgi:hypothetical protein
MSFEQRFLDLIFGFMLGVVACSYNKYSLVNDNWIKIIAIITLCVIVLNSDFLIDTIIIFLLLLVSIQIILSNFL